MPRLFLFSNGPELVAQWAADDADAFPHMPTQFVGTDTVHLPIQESEATLREFLATVVARIDGLCDDPATQLRTDWRAHLNG